MRVCGAEAVMDSPWSLDLPSALVLIACIACMALAVYQEFWTNG